MLRDNLHSYLRKRLVGEIGVNPENGRETIRSKIEEKAGEWVRTRENEVIEEVFEHAYAGGKAVIGAGPTIKALMNGQVHTLVVQPGAVKEGFVCPNDHYLSLVGRSCPVCERELERRENIIDEMVDETIAQSGEVVHLFNYEERLEDHETAALLRFVV